ncbi:MAG TPA: dehydrogenase [Lentisphaeria bacterium]|nr:MAG: dehydrogenase [Lentisphaerae bacterium GWF2_38_69]HBM14908.1 dehydrogenase [Lentisphaeria bacterium]
MKAITFNPENDKFSLKEVPVPKPINNQILVKVEAAGLNPVDSKIIYWKKMVNNMSQDWIPGLDVSGYVEAIGESVKNFKAGDRVLYHGDMFKRFGGFAQYALQNADTVIKHPELDAVRAAATPCAGWTAWRALVDKLRITSEDTIFIAGGAGGVGSFAIQIAKYFKLGKIITTCSAQKTQYVRDLGATHIIDYKNSDVVEEVLKITAGEGVTKGLDAVGRDNDILVADSLSYEGEMVELVDFCRPESYKNSFMSGLTFHQLSLGSGHRNGKKAEETLKKAGERFSGLVEDGAISVSVTKVISFTEVPDALTEMLLKKSTGKIVLKI